MTSVEKHTARDIQDPDLTPGINYHNRVYGRFSALAGMTVRGSSC